MVGTVAADLIYLSSRLLGSSGLVTAFLIALQLVPLALIYAISIGRRWAFIAYVVWLLYGVVHVLLRLPIYFDAGLITSVRTVAELAVDAVAVVLMLTPAARGWLWAAQARHSSE